MVISAPIIKPVNLPEYPSSDGEPVAETYDHFYAIAVLLEMLRQYLTGRKATVLGLKRKLLSEFRQLVGFACGRPGHRGRRRSPQS